MGLWYKSHGHGQWDTLHMLLWSLGRSPSKAPTTGLWQVHERLVQSYPIHSQPISTFTLPLVPLALSWDASIAVPFSASKIFILCCVEGMTILDLSGSAHMGEQSISFLAHATRRHQAKQMDRSIMVKQIQTSWCELLEQWETSQQQATTYYLHFWDVNNKIVKPIRLNREFFLLFMNPVVICEIVFPGGESTKQGLLMFFLHFSPMFFPMFSPCPTDVYFLVALWPRNMATPSDFSWGVTSCVDEAARVEVRTHRTYRSTEKHRISLFREKLLFSSSLLFISSSLLLFFSYHFFSSSSSLSFSPLLFSFLKHSNRPRLDGTRFEHSSWLVLVEGLRCLTYLQDEESAAKHEYTSIHKNTL